MATRTENIKLIKPDLDDDADIRVINGNMDIIDRLFPEDNPVVYEQDLQTHNASNVAHADIRAEIDTDISSHNTSTSAHENRFNEFVKGVTGSNATLTITKGNGTTSTIDLIPAGIMQMFVGNTIPAGWLLCDGSAISRTDYAKLFSAIGTTWGAGDGSTTFNLPNSIGRFAEGAATSGSYKSAGLPNIEGAMGSFHTNDYSDTGQALYHTSSYQQNESYHDRDAADTFCNIVFNARKSNSIYGNSNTVQPNSFTVRYIIKY